MTTAPSHPPDSGILGWLTRHPMAIHLLTGLIFAGGLCASFFVNREVFPDSTLDSVSVSVVYPGATASQVEREVIRPIEASLVGMEGVVFHESRSLEQEGRLFIELQSTHDPKEMLKKIESTVRLDVSLPSTAMAPRIELEQDRIPLLNLIVSADLDRTTLWNLGRQVRDDLIQNTSVTQVHLQGPKQVHVGLEVSPHELVAMDMELQELQARTIAHLERHPMGALETAEGEVALQLRPSDASFEEHLLSAVVDPKSGSTPTTLRDLVVVRESRQRALPQAYFNGKPALKLRVYRAPGQHPVELADSVRRFIQRHKLVYTDKVHLHVWQDSSQEYAQRSDLLGRNALTGLLLVFLILMLFLETRVALWVTLGLPLCFAGVFIFMWVVGISVNMISLFGFVIVLGILVDDAIVVGESIHEHQRHQTGALGAIQGARQVAMPVVVSVLTTALAFCPIFLIPGSMGKLFASVPMVIIALLLLSLGESLCILPVHLMHMKQAVEPPQHLPSRTLRYLRARVDAGLQRLIQRFYLPSLALALKSRYVTLAIAVGVVICTVGVIAGEHLPFTFFPNIEGNVVRVGVQFPVGTPVTHTRKMMKHLEVQALNAAKSLDPQGGKKVLGVYSVVGKGFRNKGGRDEQGGHLLSLELTLVDHEQRRFSSKAFEDAWRQATGIIPMANMVAFDSSDSPAEGANVGVTLTHKDPKALQAAATQLGKELARLDGLYQVDDGVSTGKQALSLSLKPKGVAMGLSTTHVSEALRQAFFGAQVGRRTLGEVEHLYSLRWPKDLRASTWGIEQVRLRTPDGSWVTLPEVVNVEQDRTYAIVEHIDGKTSLEVTAQLDVEKLPKSKALRHVRQKILPKIKARFPDLEVGKSRSQANEDRVMRALGLGALAACLLMYVLIALTLKSYVEPLLVLCILPLAPAGAFMGHLLLGLDLSLISVIGIIALLGVAVNDTLVLLVAIKEGEGSWQQRVQAAGARRLRPIVLTSLTTFFGMLPMLFERSVDAKFLVPMAVSLGFGILFVTVLTLYIVPALYVVLLDLMPNRGESVK